jgi:hypothetical protein
MSVHVSENLSPSDVKNRTAWILSLDKSLNIAIDSVDKTKSTGLIMEVPASLFSQISNMPGVSLVFDDTADRVLSLNVLSLPLRSVANVGDGKEKKGLR